MSRSNDNKQAYLPGSKPAHITIHEWRTAENSAQYLLPTLQDISAEVLERARANIAERGVENVNFRVASVYDLPFPDESFDVVHAQQVLCHLDDPVRILQSMIKATNSVEVWWQ